MTYFDILGNPPLSTQNQSTYCLSIFYTYGKHIGILLTQIVAMSILMEINKKNIVYPYQLCQIRTRKNNLEKRWYLEYYIWHLEFGKLKRMQLHAPLNMDANQRLAYLQKKKQEIDRALSTGKMAFSEVEKKKRLQQEGKAVIIPTNGTAPVYFKDALEAAVRDLLLNTREDTVRTYTYIKRKILLFLESHGYENILLHLVSERHIKEYFSWYKELNGAGGRTLDNHRVALRAFFNAMIANHKDLIETNPVNSIKKFKYDDAANWAFSVEEKQKLLNWFKQNDLFMYYFVQIMYYSHIRITELWRLKTEQILTNVIIIPGGNAKTRKTNSVYITDPQRKVLEEMGAFDAPKGKYLFGKDELFSSVRFHEQEMFTKRHAVAIKALDMPNYYTLTSWRDTGLVDFYQSCKDLRLTQERARHSKSETTIRYLRSLGISVYATKFDNAPTL